MKPRYKPAPRPSASTIRSLKKIFATDWPRQAINTAWSVIAAKAAIHASPMRSSRYSSPDILASSMRSIRRESSVANAPMVMRRMRLKTESTIPAAKRRRRLARSSDTREPLASQNVSCVQGRISTRAGLHFRTVQRSALSRAEPPTEEQQIMIIMAAVRVGCSAELGGAIRMTSQLIRAPCARASARRIWVAPPRGVRDPWWCRRPRPCCPSREQSPSALRRWCSPSQGRSSPWSTARRDW